MPCVHVQDLCYTYHNARIGWDVKTMQVHVFWNFPRCGWGGRVQTQRLLQNEAHVVKVTEVTLSDVRPLS